MYTNVIGCDIARFKVYMECGDTTTELFRTTDSAYKKWTRVRAPINGNPGDKCKVSHELLLKYYLLLLYKYYFSNIHETGIPVDTFDHP